MLYTQSKAERQAPRYSLFTDLRAAWKFSVTFVVSHSCLPFCALEGLTTDKTWWYPDKFNTHSLTYSLRPLLFQHVRIYNCHG